jgi:RNA polymerase sigma-70 factor (ECF subfamily)
MNLTKLTDKELVRLVQTGNGYKNLAFTEIFNRYKPRIEKFLLRMLRNKEEAEDQTQISFSNLFRNIGRYQEKEVSFSAWVYRIAINNGINYLRAQKRRPQEDDSIELGELEQHFFMSPEREIESAEAIERINSALDRLPDEYRTILIFRTQGMSYEDIASILNLPLGTVKSGLHRGRKMVKKDYTLNN